MFTLKIWCEDKGEVEATAEALMRALQGHMEHSITMLTGEPILILNIGKELENPDDNYSLKVV